MHDAAENKDSSNSIVQENTVTEANLGSNIEPNSSYEISAIDTASYHTASVAVAVTEESIGKTAKHVVTSFKDVIDLAAKEREMALRHWLVSDVHLVSFTNGQIELRLTNNASTSLAGELTERLQNWTKNRWVIALSDKKRGAPRLKHNCKRKPNKKQSYLKKIPW